MEENNTPITKVTIEDILATFKSSKDENRMKEMAAIYGGQNGN